MQESGPATGTVEETPPKGLHTHASLDNNNSAEGKLEPCMDAKASPLHSSLSQSLAGALATDAGVSPQVMLFTTRICHGHVMYISRNIDIPR